MPWPCRSSWRSYRPSWVLGEAPASPDGVARAVSLTLVGDLDPELGLTATLGEQRWFVRAPLAAVERFLDDAEAGLASSLQLGPELAVVEPGAEDVVVPVGPYELVGSVSDWRTVLNREKEDRVAGHPVTGVAAGDDAYDGERSAFPVVDTD